MSATASPQGPRAGYEQKKAEKPATPTWTVMVFMGVSDFEGGQDLGEAAEMDLDEIRAVGGGGDHCLNIFVQQNFGKAKNVPDKKTIRRHFKGRKTEVDDGAGKKKVTWEQGKEVETKFDVTQAEYREGQALSAFIADSLASSGHRDTDYSLLVLWGHAYDFTFGRLLGPDGGTAALNFTAISDVLKRVQDDAKALMHPGDAAAQRPKLDIIGFDACDIATAEVAYQLKDVAGFLLASQVGVPMPGWPYSTIVERMRNPRGSRPITPAELGSFAVRRFCGAYDYTTPVSLTMLNLTHTEELFRLTQDVAAELAMAISNPDDCARIARTFERSQTEPGKPFVDVADLCLSLLHEDDFPGLVEKARALGDFVAVSRAEVDGNNDDPESWPLVVDHDRNSGELVRLNGVSLYAPNVSLPEDLSEVNAVYRTLKFVRQGRWSGVAHRLASKSDRL